MTFARCGFNLVTLMKWLPELLSVTFLELGPNLETLLSGGQVPEIPDIHVFLVVWFCMINTWFQITFRSVTGIGDCAVYAELRRIEFNLWQWGAIKDLSLGSDTSQPLDSHPHLGNLVFEKGMLKLCGKLDCSMKLYKGGFWYKILKS